MAIKDLVPRFWRGEERTPARRGESDAFHEFQQEMNRLFDDFFTGFPLASKAGDGWLSQSAFSPKVDVSETDKDITVSAELPGMDDKDITVELADSSLTIRGERKSKTEDKGKNWYRREQSYGSFQRTIPLMKAVKTDEAKARFKKGLLTVTVPKLEDETGKRKTIRIDSD